MSRGGRGGKPSMAKELMKRSAQEAGLDDRHMQVITDIRRPPLFPDFLWHSSGGHWNGTDDEKSSELVTTKRLASTVYMMNKQRELCANFAASCHYVKPPPPVDVIRYSDRNKNKNKNQAPDAAVLASMGKTNRKLATDERFFPAELIRTNLVPQAHNKRHASDENDHANSQKPPASSVKLEEDGEAKDGDEEESGVPAEAPPEEEEDGEDYTTNYYATDDEASGDDAEATF